MDSDEGELFWVGKEDLLTKEFHPVLKIILNDYLKNKREEVMVAVIGLEDEFTWWYPL